MKQEIRISQCMIVKNEERNIERALSWGKDIVWEQIVVDTGSTDRTVEIAKRMGAKVFHFQWIDDFAAAKNYAIGQASGNWIAFLDADEYFLPKDAGKLLLTLERLKDSSYNILLTGWIQVDGSESISGNITEGKLKWLSTVRADGSTGVVLSGTQTRIFRNQPGLRYRRRIHEELHMENGQLLFADASGELSILHTGYIPSELENRKKTERNMALIRQELEVHPDDYIMLACMGDSYSELDDHREAARWYEQAVVCMPEKGLKDNSRLAMIFKKLLTIYMTEQSGEDAALKVYEKAAGYFPEDADFDYLMGRLYASQKHYQKGAYHLQKALDMLEQNNSSDQSVMLVHSLVHTWELLVACYYESGDLQRCVSCAVMVLKADSRRTGALRQMLLAFRSDEERAKADRPGGTKAASPAQVRAFLGNFYDLGKAEEIEFLQKAAESVGYAGLAEELKKNSV